jgi:hypothetical protein
LTALTRTSTSASAPPGARRRAGAPLRRVGSRHRCRAPRTSAWAGGPARSCTC